MLFIGQKRVEAAELHRPTSLLATSMRLIVLPPPPMHECTFRNAFVQLSQTDLVLNPLCHLFAGELVSSPSFLFLCTRQKPPVEVTVKQVNCHMRILSKVCQGWKMSVPKQECLTLFESYPFTFRRKKLSQ